MKIASLQKKVKDQRVRRVRRVRAQALARKERPRLSVLRTHYYIYAQIIDDNGRKTIVSAHDMKMKDKKNKTERARLVGQEIAKKALAKKIKEVVFDRSWYKFHGRVRALADAAREAGLLF